MKLASLIDVYRYLNNKGYEITASLNEKNLYECYIYKDGQFVRKAKESYKTWFEAQEKTSIKMFNFFIEQENKNK